MLTSISLLNVEQVRELLARISPEQAKTIFVSPDNPTGMFSRVELVEPERAARLLAESENVPQRKVRSHRVESYSAQRAKGRWKLHHQGLALDVNGVVRDGRHRLTMVARGLPTVFNVTYNVPVDGVLHVDEQQVRSTRDALGMAGIGTYTDSIISSCRAFLTLPGYRNIGSRSLPREELVAGLQRWAEPLEWVEVRAARIKFVTRSVRAVLARASLHEDRTRLGEFCQVLKTGMPLSAKSEEDGAAITYARFLMRHGKNTEAVDSERYLKGQTAIAAFLRRENLESLRATERDLWPLPE